MKALQSISKYECIVTYMLSLKENKKPNKNLKFKQTYKYIQKKGVDPIKGITQYYYDQVVLFLESNE